MKTLVIVGDHPRNLGLLSSLFQNKKIEISGIILFERDELIPSPNKNLSSDLKRLWSLHFHKRYLSEKNFFDIDKSYEKKISNIIKIKSENEFNDKKIINFVNKLKVDLCFITGTPIIKDPLLSMLPAYSINLHLGIIPYYKGAITMFWPFYFLEPTMAGTTYHIIDKYVDTGEILHNNVPNLNRGDGMHDVASKAVLSAHKDLDLVVREVQNRIEKKIKPQKDLSLRYRGKLFLKKDWKPELLRNIYDLYDDKIVDLYLDKKISSHKPHLIKVK